MYLKLTKYPKQYSPNMLLLEHLWIFPIGSYIPRKLNLFRSKWDIENAILQLCLELRDQTVSPYTSSSNSDPLHYFCTRTTLLYTNQQTTIVKRRFSLHYIICNNVSLTYYITEQMS